MLKNIKILVWLNLLLAVIIAGYSYYISDKLPKIIPIHFNILGEPDYYVPSGAISIFTLPLLVFLMALLMAFLFNHPYYISFPSSMYMRLLPKQIREEAFYLAKRYVIKTLSIVNLLFVYIYFEMVSIWIGLSQTINTWVILSLVIALIVIILMYYHQVKLLIAHELDHHHDTKDKTH
jgi:uncharacterized membrane protein